LAGGTRQFSMQEVIFTENTAPDREIWDEKGGLIKKGAAEIAERDQDLPVWPWKWFGASFSPPTFSNTCVVFCFLWVV
jgi:hypothetical protein